MVSVSKFDIVGMDVISDRYVVSRIADDLCVFCYRSTF